jgi:hypothetical protein
VEALLGVLRRASASFERWKPGTATTRGAGASLVAVFVLKRSATTHCPFWVGILVSWTRMRHPELRTIEANTLASTTTATQASSGVAFARC